MKKILAIVISFTIAFTVCYIPVSADSGGGVGGQRYEQLAPSTAEYLTDAFDVIKNIIQNGGATDDDFNRIKTATGNYLDNTGKIIDGIADSGLSAIKDYYTDLYNLTSFAPTREDLNTMVKMGRDLLDYCGIDYGKTETTENIVDMQGAGAVARFVQYGSDGSVESEYFYYGSYGVIRSSGFDLYHYFRREWYSSGMLSSLSKDFDTTGTDLAFPLYHQRYFYGDWRNADGSSYDDTTPYQNTIQTNDPSTLTDNQLIDLLEDLLLNLKLDFPDLSTIEGLLSAILSQCQSINGKIDNLSVGSDSSGVNYEQLQSCIDTAILTLSASNADNSALIVNELIKLRESLSIGDNDDGSNWLENLFDGLFNKSTDDDGNEHLTYDYASVEGIIKNLGAILVDDKSGEVLSILTVGDVTKLGKSGIIALSSLVDLIIDFNKTLPIQTVNDILQTTNEIVFSENNPQDLVITISSADDNYLSSLNGDYVLLKSSWLSLSGFSFALQIVRAFLSFFILYRWFLWVRRYMADML